jgi:hypothetical protein
LRKRYYMVLGLTEGASITEIKSAYRKLALKYHPDRNSDPEAQQHFIEISEAYEYLINGGATTVEKDIDEQEWDDFRRSDARERAYTSSRMPYEEFISTEYYKRHMEREYGFDAKYFLISIFLVFVMPVIAFLFWSPVAIIFIILFNLIAIPFTWSWLKRWREFNRSSLKIQIKNWRNYFMHMFFLGMAFNIYLFSKYVFNTQIQISDALFLYAAAMIIVYGLIGIKHFNKRPIKKQFLAFFLTPFILNCLFMINFNLARNPVRERFHYESHSKNTLIFLENDAYDEYLMMRWFMDSQSISGRRIITYTIAEGPLGFRVVQRYQLGN